MRIPYPERIPLAGAVTFAAALLTAQLLQHTQPLFSVFCFAFIVLATMAFNLAGGLYTPAGAYIFFTAILTFILGVVVKAVVNEPADSNLVAPLRVMMVYTAGMFGLLVAASIEKRFRPHRPLISIAFPFTNLRSVYIGSAILGVASKAFWLTDPKLSPGSVILALRNTDNLLPFALMLGVIYTVRSTDGRRSLTPALACLFVLVNLQDLLTFSKQAVFTPLLCWVLGAAVSRYRLKPLNLVLIPLLIFVGLYYGTPFVQVGKSTPTRSASPLGNIGLVVNLIRHMDQTRAAYDTDAVEGYGVVNYYNKPEGLFDRLEMISIDDLLVDQTDREGVFGFEPVKEGLENLIPHFFWPNKPVPYFGNVYGHQLGILADDDSSTAVSFSAAGDAYHEGAWFGVLFVEPLCFTVIFLTFSWLVGSVRDHPAVLLLIVLIAHAGPEGALPGAIVLILVSAVSLGVAFFCRYILPVVASAFQRPALPTLTIAASAAD
jgi:hypothetical protein